LGWQVLDLVISRGDQFRTLLFSGFWDIWKLEGGKNKQTPCNWELEKVKLTSILLRYLHFEEL
jgi:hypothetical protein